ncbi:MAG: hypothetical protein PHV82_06575 [Victivallaceae bacterium]|nr:hypothetical protein [Victivallaceae bacterium]
MKLDSKAVDAAVNAAIAEAADGGFTAAAILARLDIEPANLKAEEIRIERELDADERLFRDADKDIYFVRSKFFAGREFVITPGEIEIENNILFPGHRFCVFCGNEVFPSEITLRDEEGGKLRTRQFTHEVTALMPYHIFLGSEQIFDYFIAENQENAALLKGKTSRRDVILNVFDLKNFFNEHNFTPGDALLIKIKDWDEGIFTFSYLSGSERRSSKIKEWIDDLGRAVEMVIDRFEDYLEIPDQLRWAFFMDAELFAGKNSASLDEFYAGSNRIEINFESAAHTVLARKISAPDEDFGIPDNIGISRGKINSLEELLTDVNSPLKAVEIDSYILSGCYQGNPDFDSFFRRCFGMNKLSFADDAQEVIFLNYLEDRWETIFARYNRHQDKPKAELREQILDIIDERLEFFENLRSMNIAPEQLPEKNIRKMAEVSVYFTELLEVLNSESHTLQEEDEEEIAGAVERMGEIQANEIAEIHKYLKM